MVPQEFIPSNVDEGEFEVRIVAPEAASLKAMIDVTRKLEDDFRRSPTIRLLLAIAGSGGTGINNARFCVQLLPHAQRVFTWRRLLQ